MPSTKRSYSSDSDSDNSVQEPVFNWLGRSSIEHHCGYPGCKGVLLDASAKRTCWGKHAIPCYRYHQALYIVGHQQNCSFCASEDTSSDARLAQISTEAQLLREEASTGNSGLIKSSISPEPATTANTSTATTTADRKPSPPATKRDKKAQKHQAKAVARASQNAAAITREQLTKALLPGHAPAQVDQTPLDERTNQAIATIMQHLGLSTAPKQTLSKPATKSLDKIRNLVAAELQAAQTLVTETAYRKAGFEAIVPRSVLDSLAERCKDWDHKTNTRIVPKADDASSLPTPPPSPQPGGKTCKRQRLGR